MRDLARGGSTTYQTTIIKVDVSESVARVEVNEGLRARAAELEGLPSATTTQSAVVIAERDNPRRAYDPLKEHWELLQRRIFVAKAERIDNEYSRYLVLTAGYLAAVIAPTRESAMMDQRATQLRCELNHRS